MRLHYIYKVDYYIPMLIITLPIGYSHSANTFAIYTGVHICTTLPCYFATRVLSNRRKIAIELSLRWVDLMERTFTLSSLNKIKDNLYPKPLWLLLEMDIGTIWYYRHVFNIHVDRFSFVINGSRKRNNIMLRRQLVEVHKWCKDRACKVWGFVKRSKPRNSIM